MTGLLNPIVLGVPAYLVRLVSHPLIPAYLMRCTTPACLVRGRLLSPLCTGLLTPVCQSGLLNPESASSSSCTGFLNPVCHSGFLNPESASSSSLLVPTYYVPSHSLLPSSFTYRKKRWVQDLTSRWSWPGKGGSIPSRRVWDQRKRLLGRRGPT